MHYSPLNAGACLGICEKLIFVNDALYLKLMYYYTFIYEIILPWPQLMVPCNNKI